MAGTYSKYDNDAYYSLSSKLVLSNSGTQSYAFNNNYVYENLKDNESKLITPKMIRDSILSIWDSTPFKETLIGTNSYIGIDSGDDSINKDLKSKIYLGKRFYKGSEIMSSTLLNSEVDIFLHNTKSDTSNQQIQTKISIISGTKSSSYNSSPYISSEYVVGATQPSLALNLINPNGDVSILSRGVDPYTGLNTNSGGTVSINNIVFPEYQTSVAEQSNIGLDTDILTWSGNGLSWYRIAINDNWAGLTGSDVNLYGDPVNVNGCPIEFSDIGRVPLKIGDIMPGSTFSRNSISDLLGRIIYEYLPPTCELSINTPEYLEVGTSPKILLDYVIYKRTNDLLPTLFTNMIPSSYAPITTPFSKKVTGQVEGAVITPLMATTSTFTMRVDDGESNHSITKSVTGVYPYFYGFSTQSSVSIQTLSGLNKKIEPKGDKDYDIYGSGYFYFIYDKDYGLLSNIYNNLGSNITASFSYTVKVLSSPSGYWQSKEFYVYKWSNVDQIGLPSEIYQFEY